MRACWLLAAGLSAATVPTAHFDNARTSANPSETVLTPGNVALGKFGKLGSWAVDGYIFSQPLIIPGVSINGAKRDLLVVATMNNSVYAFDANRPGVTVWSNLAFAPPYSGYPVTSPALYGQSLGCLSTPVADVANLKLYVVCENNTPNWILRELSLTTGATLRSTVLGGQVVGTGDPGGGDRTSGPNLLFYPQYEFQRLSLALANGTVYIGFSSLDDFRPYHGWLMGYRTSDLAQSGIWCATPNGWGGGIWQSGGAPAIDAAGNVYVTIGNGSGYDGLTNYSDSVVKLSPTLSLVDWFTPSNNASIDALDADVSSNRAMLVGSSLLVVAGKDFNVRAILQNCMGHLQGSSGCALQSWKTNPVGVADDTSGSYGGAFVNGVLYLPTTDGSIYGFSFSGSSFNTSPVAVKTNAYGWPGPAQMAGSCDGTSNCILWVVTVSAATHTVVRPGTLRALNPATLAEYWNSDQRSADSLGSMAKFVSPTIANGRVYVSTFDSTVAVFGLIPSSEQRGAAARRGAAR